MSFRKEIKLKIDKSKINNFKNFIFEKNFTKQYPDRLIESIYFDNINYEMFKDSWRNCAEKKNKITII